MCTVPQRQLLSWLLTGLLLAVILAVGDDLCHDEFAKASANASNTYSNSFDICELTANETKIELSIDEELERLQIESASSAVCNSLELCNLHNDDLDYFQCINDKGPGNLQVLDEITRNSTSAHTRLREDYSAVQKTLILCTLEAQEVYMKSMVSAYEELQLCRSQIEDYVEID
ncbi:uncharacterized protein Dwil_GK22062 [Drosophila willistoni]|uniref:Protein TsetseEP domain-containing protein n=1 Tax=Drosophila willistoni TaxID=7260 RepID=B4MYK8_DROWI|nr:uncharacterized protein LOC6643241 [Drosophila willistoni]EDW77197.1 uncharacterized protein Dwil_GK22062 [Drosophila willistoni]